jgi:membrane-bound serine protease (ClpP class)
VAAVHLFNHPVPAAVLLTLAFLGLVVEIRSQGFHRAGWAGLLALGTFVLAHLVDGTPLWTTVPILAGVAVLWPALENAMLRVQGGVGILLVGAGAYLVMIGPGPAHLDHARAGAVLLASALLVLLAATLLWSRLPAAERRGRGVGVFFLSRSPDEPVGVRPSGRPGTRGQAMSPLRPGGWALIAGERREVVVEGEWVEEGDVVEVVAATGLHVLVRRVQGDREGLDAPPSTP